MVNIGQRVKINMPDTVWHNKEGVVENINDSVCTVFVDFIPEEGKKIRQDFNLDNISGEEYNNTMNEEISLTEASNNIDAYLNPRTKRVWSFKENTWVDRPTTWNKLIKLPLDRKDLMSKNYYDLKDEFNIDEIDITTDDGYYISDNYTDYHSGEGISVCRQKGYPFKRFVNKNNETAIIMFSTLQDAYDYCLKDKKEIKGE